MDLDPAIEDSLKVIEIPSTLSDAKKPEEIILREVIRCGYSEDAAFAIKLALEEAMTNAVKHGNRNDDTKRIVVRYCVTPDRAVILVRDEGQGFSPDGVPDPTQPDRLPLPNGRGIMLMRAYMTELLFRAGGAEVCLIKRNE
ncbi:MAG: ATP-binding protein [Planctomycetota bacterium]|jgi:serine/threonine-protein kinase RsbW